MQKLLVADVVQNKPGLTVMVEHHIKTGSAHPVRLPPYHLPHACQEPMNEKLDEMLRGSIIKQSFSEWSLLIGKGCFVKIMYGLSKAESGLIYGCISNAKTG